MSNQGMNKAFLMGNLGADPELRYTGNGTAVLNMRLATREEWLSDGEKKERTDWHNVVVWGNRAEALSKFLHKGSRILVEGGLRTSSYEDKDNVKRYKTELNATEIILCDKKPGGSNRQDDGGDDSGDGGNEQQNRQSNRQGNQNGGNRQGGGKGKSSGGKGKSSGGGKPRNAQGNGGGNQNQQRGGGGGNTSRGNTSQPENGEGEDESFAPYDQGDDIPF